MSSPSSTASEGRSSGAECRVPIDTLDAAREMLEAARRDGCRIALTGGGGLTAALSRGSAADLVVATARLDPGRIDIEASELVVSVSSGTRVAALEAQLAAAGVMLPFEPAWDRGGATGTTVGGLVAVGLSGSRRPWAGSLRDAVLGMRVIDSAGQLLNFGGRVMKNVAGFDLSRALVGSFGGLALIDTVHFKLLPRPRAEMSLQVPMPLAAFIDWATIQRAAALPLSGLGWWNGRAHLRLSGGPRDVESAYERLLHSDAEVVAVESSCWTRPPEQRASSPELTAPHDKPFTAPAEVSTNGRTAARWWRLCVPPATPHAALAPLADRSDMAPDHDSDWVIEWGGGLRFCRSTLSIDDVRGRAEAIGGIATIWSGDGADDGRRLHPRCTVRQQIEDRLRDALDPQQRWWSPILDAHRDARHRY